MLRMSGLVGVGILGLALAVGVGVSGDAKKEKQPGKVKGQLPAGWKALKLSPTQVEKIYGIQTDYRARIEEVEKKLEELRTRRHAEMLKVLTAEQKAKLVGETAPTDKGTVKDKETVDKGAPRDKVDLGEKKDKNKD